MPKKNGVKLPARLICFRKGFAHVFGPWLAFAGCIPGEFPDRFASEVDVFSTAITSNPEDARVPDRALGAPDGRSVPLTKGSVLVLRFHRSIRNGQGADVSVIEVGPSDESRAEIAASSDGTQFSAFAIPALTGSSFFDLEELGLEAASFIRVTGGDVTLPTSTTDDAGFDLDAIEALH